MKNKFLLIAIAAFLFSQIGLAQDEALVADYKAFVEKTFEQDFNSMSETRKVDPFMANFSETFVGTIVDIGLDGKGDKDAITYENLRNSLLRLIGKGSITIKWDITDITYTNVKGKTGVSGFLVTATYFRDGEVIRELTNMGEIVSTKTHTGWKITYFSLMSIEESVFRGSCYCDIYSQDKKRYLTQTYVPNGAEFEMSTDNIVIGEYRGKRFIRINDEVVFYWNLTTGKITIEEKEIGVANGPSLAIKLVLKYLNNEHCSSMKSRKANGK
jgi:hypothetical protein